MRGFCIRTSTPASTSPTTAIRVGSSTTSWSHLAPIPPSAGGVDAFVAKLSPPGSALVYSTYVGGSGGDEGFGIAVDPAGSAYVTGRTFSTNFPTTMSGVQPNSGGGNDAFVAKIGGVGQ